MNESDYELIRSIDRSYQAIPDSIRTPEIKMVALAFVKNMDRALSSPSLVMGLIHAMYMELILAGIVRPTIVGSARPKSSETYNPFGGQPNSAIADVSSRILARGTVEHGQKIADGLGLLLPSLIVDSWTAFEVLAGDLWNAAFELLPAGYKSLTGSSNRIWIAALTARNGGQIPPLSGQSGLRPGSENHGFASLSSIRQSYSVLFSENYNFAETKEIDAALANNYLGSASLYRNLIVHKAGIVDQAFLDGSSGMPDLPECKLNEPVPIDGKVVKVLVDSMASKGCHLTKGVERWTIRARGN